MKRIAAGVLAAVAITASAAGAQIPQRGTYAITNANVLTMENERVLQDQNVIVRDGRIVAFGPAATTTVPTGATRIDARGKFLMPGLAEMHGHIPGGNAATAEDVLFLYVAAGATTVRGMQGNPTQIELRRRVNAGEIIGPRMWLAAPQLANNIIPDTAVARVRLAKSQGFDLLKVHEG